MWRVSFSDFPPLLSESARELSTGYSNRCAIPQRNVADSFCNLHAITSHYFFLAAKSRLVFSWPLLTFLWFFKPSASSTAS